jgi:hypothetical protein
MNSTNIKFIETVVDIRTKESLENFFRNMDTYLIPNSCTIIKFNRITGPGHYVLISKHDDNSIWTYDPLMSTQGKCHRRLYKGYVSDAFLKSFENNGYVTVSVLLISGLDSKTQSGGSAISTYYKLPPTIMDELIRDINKSRICIKSSKFKTKSSKTKSSKTKSSKTKSSKTKSSKTKSSKTKNLRTKTKKR